MKLLAIFFIAASLVAAAPGYQVVAPSAYGYQGPFAPLAHDGRVLDTPEVAQAKAAHLAAHAAAASRASRRHQLYDQGPVYDYNQEPSAYETAAYSAPHYQRYQGPPAPLAHDGRVVDTPEVAHARATHLAAHARAASIVSQYGGYEDEGGYRGRSAEGHAAGYVTPVRVSYTHSAPVLGYQGPPAPLDDEGRVIDTPEVAQAKAAHLQAYAKAAALASHEGYSAPEGPSDDHSLKEGPSYEENYYY